MAKMTDELRINKRIQSTETSLEMYKRKIHRIRRIVAGDIDATDSWGSSSNDQDMLAARPYEPMFPDILVSQVEEGRSNRMLQALRTLTLQVAYTFPDVEFQNVDALEAELNTEYVRQRLGPSPTGCDARHSHRLALLDYLMGGIGAVFGGYEQDKPVLQCVDTMDIAWDQAARFPQEVRWVSIRIRQPLWFWQEMFGKRAINAAWDGQIC